uniref:Uncharacterized protein n=1 Tax=Denticeps clupeoides TaxID=299321 RepID=A0AAY4A6M6_9TELE
MAASVIRTLSDFGLVTPLQPCFLPAQEEEELEEEELEEKGQGDEEDGEERDEEDGTTQREGFWSSDSALAHNESTNRLLRFAELISSDVRRYFGRSQEPDSCDIYAEQPCPGGGGRQRYYDDLVRIAHSKEEEPNTLGPLAELFQAEHRKGRGLPMSQRRLPISFWTEPHPGAAAGMLGASGTPDFSDLLAHWATEKDNESDLPGDTQG